MIKTDSLFSAQFHCKKKKKDIYLLETKKHLNFQSKELTWGSREDLHPESATYFVILQGSIINKVNKKELSSILNLSCLDRKSGKGTPQ